MSPGSRPPAGGADVCGLVVVDKPAGPTSHDVVARLRRAYGTRRVGHAGTLDPPATGVLLVGLGRGTRILQYLQALPKCYRAEVAFGITTSTQDATGEVLESRPCAFGRGQLEAAIARMTGTISQVPPMVSAVRVGGERLYVAARRGEEVERPARQVTVHEFVLESFGGPAPEAGEAPESGEVAESGEAGEAGPWVATVWVRCSSGTYVRTLAADIGEYLGCGAHLRSLRRLSVGSLGVSEAFSPEEIEAMDTAGRRAVVMPLAAALRDLPAATVTGSALDDVCHGRVLRDVAEAGGVAEGAAVAVRDPGGDLVAVYRHHDAGLKAECVLV